MFEISYTGKTWYEVPEQAIRDLLEMEYQDINLAIAGIKERECEVEFGQYAPCLVRFTKNS